MANFKGFKQVSLATYNGLTDEEKKQYLWLVRDVNEGVVASSAIYFGTRKYAEVNDNSASEEQFSNLLASLGNLVDENGEFVGFLPVEEHELLASAETITEAFSILENAILAAQDELAGKVSQDEYDAKVAELEAKNAELEGKIDDLASEVASAVTADIESVKSDVQNLSEGLETLEGKVDEKADKSELDELGNKVEGIESDMANAVSALTEEIAKKADASDVYTKDQTYSKEEVDAKVAGVFHFVGDAEAISADETVITVNGEDIVASEDNEGDTYQIGDAEYASNGSKWVKLGFNMDLTGFATKEELASGLTEEAAARQALADELGVAQEAIAQEIQDREALSDKVDGVIAGSTTTASTFSDAEQMDLQLGQIVYVLNEEVGSGITYVAGAYINTQDGLKKLDSTAPSTSTTIDQRVESLENKMGNASFEGESITAAIAALQADAHTLIEGDDVEE